MPGLITNLDFLFSIFASSIDRVARLDGVDGLEGSRAGGLLGGKVARPHNLPKQLTIFLFIM